MNNKPRIFISYRRSDNITMTGRIHDRLSAEFGKHAVFRDMEDIPAGADFRVVLNEVLEDAAVVLAIIGPKWANIADEQGKRRLDDPNDFVRAEIEMALARPKTLLIPILIDSAVMPTADVLPLPIKDLAFRNAVMVRNDPDYSRDMEALSETIKKHLGVTRQPSQRLPVVGVALVAVFAVAILAFLLLQGTAGSRGTVAVATIAPVQPDEYMVLVAHPEPIRNPASRDVAGFVAADLDTILNKNISFSKIRIRQYPGVIKSDSEANGIAQQTGASVIVWGNYTDQDVTLNVQIGSFARFAHLRLDRSLLERTVNVQVRMNDEQKQSVAFPVLCVLAALQAANDDVFEFQRGMAMLYLLKVEAAPILKDTVSANMHRGFQLFFANPPAALSSFDAALKSDPSNPIIYLSRTVLHVRQGQIAQARADSASGSSLAPKGWQIPAYTGVMTSWAEGKLDSAIAEMDGILKVQTDSWYPIYFRGLLHFLAGHYPQARADIEKSFTLTPTTNFPYILGTLMALREGRLVDAANLNVKLQREFPDTTYGQLIIDVIMGSGTQRDMKELFNVASLLYLRRYTEVVTATDQVLKDNITTNPVLLANAYLARGFALCNLGDDRNAEAAYSTGLSLDADNITLYMLRAEVRRRLQNPLGAAQDILSAQAKSPANITPYLQANTQGKLTCKNGLESLLSVTPQP